jgi:hypothetical protein
MEASMLKQMAITTLAAVALFSGATVATAPFTPAAAQVSITFGSPPPPPIYEAVPQPRPGYVWAPGQYRLVQQRYVWAPGQWQAARQGYRYVPDTWERVHVGNRDQWAYHPSRWDRDGDGIPNRYDRHDNRPPKGGPMGDRDHDGIPNAYDHYNDRR